MNKSFIALAASCSFIAVSLISLPGCGDDGFGKRYPVSGTIKYKGEPVVKGSVTFTPTESANGRTASGELSADGGYTLTTASSNDGALPGKYYVTIVSMEVDTSKVNATVAAKGGAGRQDEIAKATKVAKRLVPAKYSIPSTSKLEATVEEKQNTFDFDLTD
jgi:hypothetical protein